MLGGIIGDFQPFLVNSSKLQKLLKVEASTFPVGEMFLFSWEISWEMFLGLEVPVTVVVINIY